MMNHLIKAKVTAEKAIIRKGTVVRLQNTGNDFYLVVKSNGRSTNPMTLWLRSAEFEVMEGGVK